MGGCPAQVGGREDPPAVDDDGGTVGPLLLGGLLHLLHQVQERGCPVWGLLVGPGRKPVMLQASLFGPALSRRQRPTPDHVSSLSPQSTEMGIDGRRKNTGGRTQGVGPLASAIYTTLPSGTRKRPKASLVVGAGQRPAESALVFTSVLPQQLQHQERRGAPLPIHSCLPAAYLNKQPRQPLVSHVTKAL